MLRQEQNLYGAKLFLAHPYETAAVEEYITAQERAHLAEGLELQQRTVRELPYIDGHVRGFGGQSMTMVNQTGYREAKKQYLAGDQAAWCLMRRREHDVRIARCCDALMADGNLGDVIMAVSPYEEEEDDATAKRLGFWPEFRRSYVWLYRKKDHETLECVEISIDQSSVATYKRLLHEYGMQVPESALSHDLPNYLTQLKASNNAERNGLINNIISRYKELNDDPVAAIATNGFEAVEFLDKHARSYIKLLVDVHRAIAESLETGTLSDLVRLSASRALKQLNCLDYHETARLRELLSDNVVGPQHSFALSTLLAAQRYGTWEAISNIVGRNEEDRLFDYRSGNIVMSFQAARFLDHIFGNTNQAAAQAKTMPGCAGGISFLQQEEAAIKSSIFGGEKYRFDKKMYCVVCQTPPKEGESKKWCGPCGICRLCDSKLQAKNTRSITA